jgi:hypothetical protein
VYRASKGTQESEVRANLRSTTEIISNRSLYSSPDYFPDFDAANNDFFESLKTKRSYFSILIERFAQSIDDYQLSSNTKNVAQTSSSNNLINEKREKIVVLGSGWGSHSFLKV